MTIIGAECNELCIPYIYSVIEILLKHKSEWIADDDEDGNTPLHLAALNGHHKCAKVLLDSQADIHAR